MRIKLRSQPDRNTLLFHRMASHLSALRMVDQLRALDLATLERVRAAWMKCATGRGVEGIGYFAGHRRTLFAGHLQIGNR